MRVERGMWSGPVALAESPERSAGELFIYDQIGEDWLGAGVSADRVAREIASLGDVDVLNVRINSPGGLVTDGHAIFSQLVRHPAEVIVDIDGIAASAASFVAMAGDRVRMGENAIFMIHDPWSMSVGNADDFRKEAEILDTFKESIMSAYMRRVDADRENELREMMTSETWLTASEALEFGFVDVVGADAPAPAANSWNLSRYRNTPAHLLAPAEPEPAEPDQPKNTGEAARLRRRLELAA